MFKIVCLKFGGFKQIVLSLPLETDTKDSWKTNANKYCHKINKRIFELQYQSLLIEHQMAKRSKEEAWAERISREGRSLGVLLRETLPEIKADIELLRDKQTDAFYKLPESDQEGVLGVSKNRSIAWLENAIGDIEACIRDLTNSIE